MHVGQTKITAGVSEGETFVVQSRQVQNGGTQIVEVHLVFHCIINGGIVFV